MKKAKDIHFALNSDSRRKILKLSIERRAPISPLEAAEHLGEPLSNVSYQFRMLKQCGVVRLTRTEPRGGSLAHFYVIKRSIAAKPWVREALGLNAA